MKMKLLTDVGKDLQELTPDLMHTVWEQLQEAERKHTFVTFDSIEDTAVRHKVERLFHQLDTIGGRLPHSNASRVNARREIYALMLRLGMPDLFVTVNPADMHSPLLCYLAGADVQFGPSDAGIPLRLPTVTWTFGSLEGGTKRKTYKCVAIRIKSCPFKATRWITCCARADSTTAACIFGDHGTVCSPAFLSRRARV